MTPSPLIAPLIRYHWVRDHTPEDSRIMAWWDYGYQITGIGKRTSLATDDH